MTCDACPAAAVTMIPYRLCRTHAIEAYQTLVATVQEAIPAIPKPLGPRFQRRYLTEADVLEIRQAHAAGQSFGVIARTRGMSPQQVRSIAIRRTWKDVGASPQ